MVKTRARWPLRDWLAAAGLFAATAAVVLWQRTAGERRIAHASYRHRPTVQRVSAHRVGEATNDLAHARGDFAWHWRLREQTGRQGDESRSQQRAGATE